VNQMKMLLILRHAKSSWDDPNLPDYERPLNKRGKKDAPRMGQFLKDQDLIPDLVLCSTAQRARDTADLVIAASGYAGELRLMPDLYSFNDDPYLQALQGISDRCERVMLIGHNPGLEELLVVLTGEVASLPTAALAQVHIPIKTWAELLPDASGKLINVWKPKDFVS